MTPRCTGTTIKGDPCLARAEHGYLTCPQHRMQDSRPVSTKKVLDANRAASLSRHARPVTNWDRDDNGDRIGLCPACRHHRWWDNRSKKRAGQISRAAPEFRCVKCGFAIWPKKVPTPKS